VFVFEYPTLPVDFLVFAANLLAVYPIPSAGSFTWLVTKKGHSVEGPKFSAC
jgi:hypothetical protein